MGFIIDGLFDYLSDIVKIIIMSLLYPFITVLAAIYDIMYNIISTITGFFNALYVLASVIYTYFASFLTIFPSIWSVIMLTAIITIISLRIYNLLWGGNNG